MELLDRYLKDVKGFLPRSQQDDIIQELSENIQAQMDDRAAELGRPLDEAEQKAILQQHGNPMVVASRYVENPRTLAFGRQLIGPVLFPMYLRVLWLTMGIASVAHIFVASFLLANGDQTTIEGTISAVFWQLIVQFTIVTLIFAIADKNFAGYSGGWDTRYRFSTGPKKHNTQEVSRVESFAQLVVYAIFLLWFSAIERAPHIIFPATAPFQPATIWQQLVLTLMLIIGAGLVQAFINLIMPQWVLLRDAYRVLSGVIWLVFVGVALKTGEWLVPSPTSPSDLRQAITNANQVIFFTLGIWGIISVVIVANDIRRLFRSRATVSPNHSS